MFLSRGTCAFTVLVICLLASHCFAGDVVGTVSAPKQDRVVVFVQGVKGAFPAIDATIDQRNLKFIPYVLPVVKGTKVAFHNDDALAHNVFGVGADEFNLGTFSNGQMREHTFNKEGDVTLLCNTHSEMEGHVLVLGSPYFSRLDGSGNFHIAAVPAGEYVIEAWYAGKVKKQSVKVPASGRVTVTF